MSVAFDEMKGGDGTLRPAYGELYRWLGEVPPDVLDYRRREAEVIFRRIGITFAVYGEADAHERLIPFDVLPRILSAAEWDVLRAGLEQRIQAINLYIGDIYSRREILRAGIVPEDLVFQNSVFRPEMSGQKVPHGIYVHIGGIDIVRVDAETFYVLEDNARTPSGVSYMLENREIMLRLFPELFARHRVAPVENYPDELLATLDSVAPADRERGSGRRAAHSRRLQLGLLRALVSRRQTRCRAGGRARPVRQGRFRVHAHDAGTQARRRHLPADRRRFPRSPRLPARFRARRAGTDVGLPGRQRHAGECGRDRHRRRQGGLQLHAGNPEVLSRRGTDPQERPDLAMPGAGHLAYVLDHLEELVVKEVHGSGGYGMLVGPKADKATTAAFRAKLKATPKNFVAQPTLALSTCPTCVEEGVAPRHVDLRPFVLTGRDRIRIVPGGLTRVALKKGSLVVNSSQGGGTKDTWVLDR